MNRYSLLPTYRYYEAEGYPLSLGKTAGKPLRNYRIYGNTVDGVGVGEQEPYGYKIPVISRGKNLCDNVWENGWINISSGLNQGGVEYIRSSNYLPIKNGIRYYLSSLTLDGKDDGTNQTVSWYYYDKDKRFISAIVSWKDRYITPPDGTAYVRFSIHVTKLNTLVQVEQGSSATAYEPYVEPTTANIYLNEPLLLGQYVDFKADDLPEIRTKKQQTNIIETQTTVPPSKIWCEYYK